MPSNSNNPSYDRKLLPWTSFVSSALYRTDIFSVERWVDRPRTETWVHEIESLTSSWSDRTTVPLLCKVASSVDYLESCLQSTEALHMEAGLGLQPAKPINAVYAGHTAKYLVTQLLDRLYWANQETDPLPGPIVHRIHPELKCDNR